MRKREIDPYEYATEINRAFAGGGMLVTSKSGDETNVMTIGWGGIGRFWQEACFIAFIREGRHTRKLIDESGEFTVNIPYGDVDKSILGYCGSRSGRDVDKIKERHLTLVESDTVRAPAIKEMPLTLECRVWYRQLQDKAGIPEDILESIYPADKDSSYPMANRDPHIAYYGRILKAYIIEDD